MPTSRAVLLAAVAAVVLALTPAAASGSAAAVAPAAKPSVVPLHAFSASARRDWFWSSKAAQLTLLDNGIYWPQTRQHWRVDWAQCTGLGHWILRRRVARFRNFYCRVAA